MEIQSPDTVEANDGDAHQSTKKLPVQKMLPSESLLTKATTPSSSTTNKDKIKNAF